MHTVQTYCRYLKKKIPANVDFTPEQNGLLTPERGPFLKKRRGIYYTFDEKKSDVRGDGKKPLQVTQTEEGIPGAMVTFLSRRLKVIMILFCCRLGKREKPINPEKYGLCQSHHYLLPGTEYFYTSSWIKRILHISWVLLLSFSL